MVCLKYNEKRGFRDPCAFEWQQATNISQNKSICRSHTGSSFVEDLWSLFHQATVYIGGTPASNWVNGTIVLSLPFQSFTRSLVMFRLISDAGREHYQICIPFPSYTKSIPHLQFHLWTSPLKWFPMKSVRWQMPRKIFLMCMQIITNHGFFFSFYTSRCNWWSCHIFYTLLKLAQEQNISEMMKWLNYRKTKVFLFFVFNGTTEEPWSEKSKYLVAIFSIDRSLCWPT